MIRNAALERIERQATGIERKKEKLLELTVDTDERKSKIYLDIRLSLGEEYRAEYVRTKQENIILSFDEIHISRSKPQSGIRSDAFAESITAKA